MNRSITSFLVSTCISCLALLLAVGCDTTQPTAKSVDIDRPNVVLILTDDQGYGDFSFHGNDSISTPNLDALARESVQFDRFYVSPLCAPTRASLLTGRYHPRTGVTGVTGRREVMRAEEQTLAEVFGGAGYNTGLFGKWHNGEQYPNDPIGQGFNTFLGFTAGHWNNYFDTKLTYNQFIIDTKGYISDVLTDSALAFIDRQAEQPFFCYVSYNTPHSPMQLADSYYDIYKEKGLTDYNAAVYGMCQNIDDNVARILQRLEQHGIAENTILIFTTDNGPNGDRYNGNMKGWKGWPDEGGVRVPLFIRYPAASLRHGEVVKPLAAHIDLLPTLAELCQIPLVSPLPLDGVSLVPLLQNKAAEIAWPERYIYTLGHGNPLVAHPGAIRTLNYRWVLNRDSSISLYNMTSDPSQKVDVAAQQPELAQRLGKLYQAKFDEVTAQMDRYAPAIPVGFAAAPKIRLPVTEAKFMQATEVTYKEGHGWANDWLTRWTQAEDRIFWPLDIREGGDYAIYISYTAPAEATPSLFAIQVQNQELTYSITDAFDPEYLASPDRVPRKEVYEKPWKTQEVGRVALKAGRSRLSFTLAQAPNQGTVDIKEVWLHKI